MRIYCLVALFVSGCATVPTGMKQVAEGKRQLDSAKICCASLGTAQKQSLPKGKSTIVVDDTLQAFDFGVGKTFFVLFEMPVFDQTYAITVSSLPAGPLADMALFVPHVTLYDAAFKPTRFFDEKTLRNRGNTLERTIFINPQNSSEKYLVVSGANLVADIETSYSMVTYTPMVAGPFIVNMAGGQDGKTKLRTSPTGQLEVEVSSSGQRASQ